MPDKNDFSRKTRETLAKRANQICSNPSCRKPTVGPHSDEDKNVDVGEAAHIRGARIGSKRYDPSMLPEERGSIVNGIWLCRKCAKLIDSDEKKYTVDLLYEWKRKHEAQILQDIEGYEARKNVPARQLQLFENESAAAYQIVADRPRYWEHLLTIELLRSKRGKIDRSFRELDRGTLFRPAKTLTDKYQMKAWLSDKIGDFIRLLRYLETVLKEDMVSAMGSRTIPGDPGEILYAVNKFMDACAWLLNWEIDLHFTNFPQKYEPIRNMMRGWTKQTFLDVNKFPEEIAKMLDSINAFEKNYTVTLIVGPPKDVDNIFPLFYQIWQDE
jgi:hypothetical protein